jgi:hypothetical protein
MQRCAKDREEDNRGDDRLEGEEILDFGVWNAEERYLQKKVEQEPDHARSRDTLVFRDGVVNSCEAWPRRRQQYGHALPTSDGLNTKVMLCQQAVAVVQNLYHENLTQAR